MTLRRPPIGRWFLVPPLLAAAIAVAWLSILKLDAAYPPPMDRLGRASVEVVDRNGELLRVFANADDRWRMEIALDDVDSDFIDMLIAYEDKRFYRHYGIDPLAMIRAAGQFVANGEIVSGGSTITMQLARLMEPRAERSLAAKLRQIARALQLERRLTKRQILTHYLTLAPYGGNLEGIRAASMAWFRKEPRHLTLEQAALLVALPQSPETRRPDRHPDNAAFARNRVIERMTRIGLVPEGEAARSARIAVPSEKRPMPALAPHLARSAQDRDPSSLKHRTTIEADLQAGLERLAADAAARIGERVSVAILVAEIASGEIRASVGSPGLDAPQRDGWIDMTRARRSPGSTLKPYIYGIAIEEGLVLPETLIADRPVDFGGYRPTNFDGDFRGDVSIRVALQLSLNIPAVKLLDRIGPARLLARLRRAGIEPAFAEGDRPGLGVALGGVSLSLHDLVQLYVNLAGRADTPVSIGDGIFREPGRLRGVRAISRVAAWHVGDMLSGMPRPAGSRNLSIAYKTGTSYGHRDAWAIGFDGNHAVGVWVGRPDNGVVAGLNGAGAAAPILFEAFDLMQDESRPLPPAPAGAVRMAHADLPAGLRYFNDQGARYASVAERRQAPLAVSFPPAGAELEMRKMADGEVMPVIIKLQGGAPPFHLLANGRAVERPSRKRDIAWSPDGQGVQRITILDAAGRARTVQFSIR